MRKKKNILTELGKQFPDIENKSYDINRTLKKKGSGRNFTELRLTQEILMELNGA